MFPLATLSGKYKRLVVPIGFEDRPEFLLSTLQPSIRVPFSFLNQSLSILRYSFSFKLVHSTTSFIAMNARDLFFVLPEMCVAALVAIIISSAVTEPSPILVSSLTFPTVRNSLKYITFFSYWAASERRFTAAHLPPGTVLLLLQCSLHVFTVLMPKPSTLSTQPRIHSRSGWDNLQGKPQSLNLIQLVPVLYTSWAAHL